MTNTNGIGGAPQDWNSVLKQQQQLQAQAQAQNNSIFNNAGAGGNQNVFQSGRTILHPHQ